MDKNFRLAGPEEGRLRDNAAQSRRARKWLRRVALPSRRGGRGPVGLRNLRWPPPPLEFPFPHWQDPGQAGQWQHHNTLDNKRPFTRAWSLLGPQSFPSHFNWQGGPGGDRSRCLSAYFKTPPLLHVRCYSLPTRYLPHPKAWD